MSLTRINWTPELIAEQQERNAIRNMRLRAERYQQQTSVRPPKPKQKKPRKTRRVIRTMTDGIVYIVRFGGLYKIGKTSRYQRRKKQLMREFHVEAIYVIHLIATDDMHKLEKELHKRYATKWLSREFFNLDSKDIAELKLL